MFACMGKLEHKIQLETRMIVVFLPGVFGGKLVAGIKRTHFQYRFLQKQAVVGLVG
jgi:hypothetical protein